MRWDQNMLLNSPRVQHLGGGYYIPILFLLSNFVSRTLFIDPKVRRLISVANYAGMLPLTKQQHLEWSLFDTFDWLTSEFDNPQTTETVRRWLEEAGLENIEVLNAGHLIGRGKVPNAPRD